MTQASMALEIDDNYEPKAQVTTRQESMRLRRPIRNQAEMMIRDLDSLVSDDHQVRGIWTFICKLDLAAFYQGIKASLDRPGRPASDPRVLLALWIYATVEGVGSARRLAKLTDEHDAYRWLRGGVPVDYHLLAEFRVSHQEDLDALMTQIVAVLVKENIVTLNRVSQDGMRVRASAGQSSFRREKTLKKCLKEAEEQVERLAAERECPNPEVSRREQAARERAARERLERVEEALRELPRVQEIKERQKKHAGHKRAAKVQEGRVSTTQPTAAIMKMPDGGFRPAQNVQFATDDDSQVILGLAVNNRGTDQGQALPIEEQVARRTGRDPKEYLIDGGFVALEDIEKLEGKGVKVYAPPKNTAKAAATDECGAADTKVEDSPGRGRGLAAWRERMETEEAKEIYKERAATAECVNALMRTRYGLQQFTVRGLSKVLSVALIMTITHNLLRWISLS